MMEEKIINMRYIETIINLMKRWSGNFITDLMSSLKVTMFIEILHNYFFHSREVSAMADIPISKLIRE
jgi:hypothetical protein